VPLARAPLAGAAADEAGLAVGAEPFYLSLDSPDDARVTLQLTLPPFPPPADAPLAAAPGPPPSARAAAFAGAVADARRFFHAVLGRPGRVGDAPPPPETPGATPPVGAYAPRALADYGAELRAFCEAVPLGSLVQVGLKPGGPADGGPRGADEPPEPRALAWTLGRVVAEWRDAGLLRRFLRVALVLPPGAGARAGAVDAAWVPVADARVVPCGLFDAAAGGGAAAGGAGGAAWEAE